VERHAFLEEGICAGVALQQQARFLAMLVHMQFGSLGLIKVPTPGTPVQVSATHKLVEWVRFEVICGGSGRVWLGDSLLNTTLMKGIIKQFWPTGVGGGIVDFIELRGTDIDLYNFWIDAGTANEGLIVPFALP